MSDEIRVEVSIGDVVRQSSRLVFCTAYLSIGGIDIAVRGVRISTDCDGQISVLPPLHAVGKGKLAAGFELPEEIKKAIVELV